MKRDLSINQTEQSVSQRRELLKGAVAFTLLSALGSTVQVALAARQPTILRNTPLFAYVGSRTTRERKAHGDGISVYKVDTATGDLTLVQLVRDLINPSFLALSKSGEYLYTVHGDKSDISAFKVDKLTGKLTFLNQQSTQGKNPVHLAIDPSGKYIVVSNHIGGSLAVLPLTSDGMLQPVTQLVPLKGEPGPHRIEQTQPKPHFNPFDPTGKYVVVPDKGTDRIDTFRFEKGSLQSTKETFVMSREGSGPRHLAFHPGGKFVYVVNEIDSTVTTYLFNPKNGTMEPLQILSTLSDLYTGNNRAAEIVIDAKGSMIYASNRGDDSIAAFKIDPTNGHLRFISTTKALGKMPRFITLSPDENYIYALNEASDDIVSFRIDKKSGQLTSTGFKIKSGSPVCMIFSNGIT